jgi:hypothetical protein
MNVEVGKEGHTRSARSGAAGQCKREERQPCHHNGRRHPSLDQVEGGLEQPAAAIERVKRTTLDERETSRVIFVRRRTHD